jgi:hypothetical protein
MRKINFFYFIKIKNIYCIFSIFFKYIPISHWVLIAFLSVLLIIPVWIVKYNVMVDLPLNLARVNIFRYLNNPIYNYNEYFFVLWHLRPYIFFDIFTYIFSFIFGVFTSGKIVISIYIVLFFLSNYLLIRSINSYILPFIFWPFLFVYNWWYSVGSINFLMGLTFGMFFISYINSSHKTNLKFYIVILIFLFVQFMCHPIAWLISTIIVIPLLINKINISQKLKIILFSIFPLFILTSLIFTHIVFNQPYNFKEHLGRLNWLLHDFYPTIEPKIYKISLFFAFLIWILVKKNFLNNIYLPLLLILVYFFMPSNINVSGHNELRVATFFLTLIPFFAGGIIKSKKTITLTTIVFIGCGFAIYFFHISKQLYYKPFYQEIESASRLVKSGSTLRPLLTFEGMNIEHAYAYITIFKGGFNPFIPHTFFHGISFKNKISENNILYDKIQPQYKNTYDYILQYTKFYSSNIPSDTILSWGYDIIYKGKYINLYEKKIKERIILFND